MEEKLYMINLQINVDDKQGSQLNWDAAVSLDVWNRLSGSD